MKIAKVARKLTLCCISDEYDMEFYDMEFKMINSGRNTTFYSCRLNIISMYTSFGLLTGTNHEDSQSTQKSWI